MTAGIWWTAVFPGIAIVLIVLGITLVGESLNDLADPRLRARKSAGEVVGSIEDTSVDPNEKPTARNEVIAELDANVDPPATVTDHDPTIVASEWTRRGQAGRQGVRDERKQQESRRYQGPVRLLHDRRRLHPRPLRT